MDQDRQPSTQHATCPLRPWVRTRPIRTMFRPQEYANLRAIAEGWRVPLATAVWAIVSDQLSRYRKRAGDLGPDGLAIAAALVVLRQRRERDGSGGANEPVET